MMHGTLMLTASAEIFYFYFFYYRSVTSVPCPISPVCFVYFSCNECRYCRSCDELMMVAIVVTFRWAATSSSSIILPVPSCMEAYCAPCHFFCTPLLPGVLLTADDVGAMTMPCCCVLSHLPFRVLCYVPSGWRLCALLPYSSVSPHPYRRPYPLLRLRLFTIHDAFVYWWDYFIFHFSFYNLIVWTMVSVGRLLFFTVL